MVDYKVGLYFTEEYYQYNFGETHPLRPLRLELTFNLFEELGLLNHSLLEIIKPRHCTQEELARVHSTDYINVVKKLSDSPNEDPLSGYGYGLGPGDNPIFKGMYETSTLICGASLMAAEKVFLDDTFKATFNPAGGLHHAHRNRASGFCIFNDIGVAIAHLKYLKKDIRIAYIDIDSHHGDGVQFLFYDDPNVLTVSYHEDGKHLFPGTGSVHERGEGNGVGFSINFPLMPYTSDKIFLDLFRKTTPIILETYKPDILLTQLGVDMNYNDPLTQMGLSVSICKDIAQTFKTSAREFCQDRWLAFGGGGYLMGVVPRAWSLYLAKMLEVELENKLPEKWYENFKDKVQYEKAPFYLWEKADDIEKEYLKNPDLAKKMLDYKKYLIELCEITYLPILSKK